MSHEFFLFFFFNDTATTEIYTLSLHDALPISFASQHRRHANRRFSVNPKSRRCRSSDRIYALSSVARIAVAPQDRKSTRLNSSHGYISYAVFCLKKKKIALTCYASVSTE